MFWGFRILEVMTEYYVQLENYLNFSRTLLCSSAVILVNLKVEQRINLKFLVKWKISNGNVLKCWRYLVIILCLVCMSLMIRFSEDLGEIEDDGRLGRPAT